MNRKIGAHVSASGGLEKAVERAYAIGANCAQIFSGSPRVWKRSALESFNTEKMFSKMKELNVSPIFTHSLYLINLASENPELLAKSITALEYDLRFDSLIHGSGIIVHLGSHQKRGWETVREQVAKSIVTILESTPKNSTFLIENSASLNGKLCSDIRDIRWLIDRVSELLKKANSSTNISRLGWCLDTCHAHAAGYLLGQSTQQIDSKLLADEISAFNLWEQLKCIHVNESKDLFGSGRDRHENLGEGTIGDSDLREFLQLPQVLSIPLLMEVPGFDGMGPDVQNIEYLQKLVL